jgi:hypothetical protein
MIKKFKFFHGINNMTYYNIDDIVRIVNNMDNNRLINRINEYTRRYETNRR